MWSQWGEAALLSQDFALAYFLYFLALSFLNHDQMRQGVVEIVSARSPTI